jgi:hypothetical protein
VCKLKAQLKIKKHKIYRAMYSELKHKLKVIMALFRRKKKGDIPGEITRRADRVQIEQKSSTIPCPKITTILTLPTRDPLILLHIRNPIKITSQESLRLFLLLGISSLSRGKSMVHLAIFQIWLTSSGNTLRKKFLIHRYRLLPGTLRLKKC